jgi:Fe-S-cluster containining protein
MKAQILGPLVVPPGHALEQRSYFFDSGIYFECLGCGNCCVGDPGVVRVSEAEIIAIAAYLNRSIAECKADFSFPFENGYGLHEHADGRCVFFEKGCTVYPVRPSQCRTFPFWISVFRSQSRFAQTARQCPGLGRGRFFSKEEILSRLRGF